MHEERAGASGSLHSAAVPPTASKSGKFALNQSWHYYPHIGNGGRFNYLSLSMSLGFSNHTFALDFARRFTFNADKKEISMKKTVLISN